MIIIYIFIIIKMFEKPFHTQLIDQLSSYFLKVSEILETIPIKMVY